MDFDAKPVVLACQLRGHVGVAVEGKQVLDLEVAERKVLYRHTEGFDGGSKHHLGEACGRHDGLTVHLGVEKPWACLGSGVCLPNVVTAGRHFGVRTEQRMAVFTAPRRRAIRDIEGRMVPRSGRNVCERASAALGRKHTHRGELRMEEERFVYSLLHRRGDDDVFGSGFDGFLDGVGEYWMWTDFDEGGVRASGGGDGLV